MSDSKPPSLSLSQSPSQPLSYDDRISCDSRHWFLPKGIGIEAVSERVALDRADLGRLDFGSRRGMAASMALEASKEVRSISDILSVDDRSELRMQVDLGSNCWPL